MIKMENHEVLGWEHAIRGMRNPLNSWDKSDSGFGCHLKRGRDCVNWDKHKDGEITFCGKCGWVESLCDYTDPHNEHREFIVGTNDLDLMTRLRNAGTDHRKFMRMLTVYVDITAPFYWWKEFDTYKVGTVANSCSTMHKIHAKEFNVDDFSHEQLSLDSLAVLWTTISRLETLREKYLETKEKPYWDEMIQLLPSSYNQKRTVMLNYEVLANIYKSRKAHKLDEWLDFCKWAETLPYAKELICGVEKDS